MIVVFYQMPMQFGPMDPPVSPFVQVAATAEIETDNEIAWLSLN